MIVSDIKVSLDVVGLCYDGSDESIANPVLVENMILKSIGKLEAIDKVRPKVALQKKGESALYTFPRSWIVPSTVLHLSVGQLALKHPDSGFRRQGRDQRTPHFHASTSTPAHRHQNAA